MLLSQLDDPSNRRKVGEFREVPKASPTARIRTMPVIQEWLMDTPHKYVLFTNRSPLDKKLYDVVIPMSYNKFVKLLAEWATGKHLQVAFAELDPSIREFIMTGFTSAQWDEMFKEEDEE